jgi:hypothetical protein
MKTFFKYDYYFQLSILVAYVLGWISIELFNINWGNYFLLFYYIVGGSQLISYLLRLMMSYPKNWIYVMYGIFIIPVWLILLYQTQIRIVNGFFFYILFSSFFYSPVLALVYIFYTYRMNILYNSNKN